MSRPITNAADLDQAAAEGRSRLYPGRLKIVIGSASCGIAMGAREVEAAAVECVKKLKLDAVVCRTGCIGLCAQEPLVDLLLPNGPRVSYCQMTPTTVRALLEAYAGGKLRPDMALARFAREECLSTQEVHEFPPGPAEVAKLPEWSQQEFFRRQTKVILRNCGYMDPMSLDEAIARGAYRGAVRAITQLKPEEVIDDVLRSGLRGRGGAAFPTGQKWRFARQAKGDVKYVVCNADEGAPGSYMDRTVLEGDPHAILEGLLIGSYAIGAREGFIYVRSEYPLAIVTLQQAIADAEARGLLGENILGTGWSFRVQIRRGAGAYVCGEETALIESIEGHAGEPRIRPPFPVTAGVQGQPTVVNNVKTWASVAPIITRGGSWYAAIGSKGTPGTTVFSLEGAVKNRGLVEVPLGTTLREVIYDIGGGVAGDAALKAVQPGGPSAGCLPPSLLDLRLDAADKEGETVGMGTGGIIIMDSSACMVDVARFLIDFFVEESCGKCVPCREGTKQMLHILTRICEGRGKEDDLPLLERLAKTVKLASFCGLGAVAPDPVLAALKHFRGEFEAHIRDKKCPAGACHRVARPAKEQAKELVRG
jgi:NADH:ubiquinone oxidoreductase subunit F (NADH-binding)/(2Fe-2S) ferredoxin